MIRGVIICAAMLAAPAASGQSEDDLYAELDAFAVAHLDSIQQMSFDLGVEFCGYIGLDENEQFVAPHSTNASSASTQPGPHNSTAERRVEVRPRASGLGSSRPCAE